MKKLILFGTILLMVSCKNSRKTTTKTTDAGVPDSLLVKPGYESPQEKIEELKKRIDFFQADHQALVEELAPFFTPQEVYIELLRRTGDLVRDTLPKEVIDNYSPGELNRISKKNKRLETLTGKDVLSLYKYSFQGTGMIIGQDNRLDVQYDPLNPQVKQPLGAPVMEDAKCVMAIIPKDSLVPDGKGNYIFLCKRTYGERFSLCGSERFLNEPAFAKGTGFVVDTTKMVTAAHCLDTSNFKNYYFLFDFIFDKNKHFSKIIDASKVYEAKSVISEYDLHKKIDYSVITLNKPVAAYRIPRLNKTGKTGMGKAYHVIGTPGGLPLKVAGDAHTMNNSFAHYFTISSDTYKGNSGSPVFNSETHEIEGIFVNGAGDFGFKQVEGVTCKFSIVCPFIICPAAPNGEAVSRVSQFIHHLAKK